MMAELVTGFICDKCGESVNGYSLWHGECNECIADERDKTCEMLAEILDYPVHEALGGEMIAKIRKILAKRNK